MTFDEAIGKLETALQPILSIKQGNERAARRQKAAEKEAAAEAEAEAAAAEDEDDDLDDM